MQNRKFHRVVSALLIAALLTTSLSVAVFAAPAQAPSAQTVASTVSGFLPGGEFSKAWLGFTANEPNSDVTITIDWNIDNPGGNGLHFYVLDENGLATVVAGGSLLDNNVASGSPVFQGPGNQEYATFRAGTDQYTVVVANDSQNDANFTISSTGGRFSDDSNQVDDPDATPTEEGAAESPAEAQPETPAEESAETPVEAAPEATAEVVATEVVTTTDTTTVTTVTTETVTTEVAATPAPVATVGTVVEVRATEIEGALPEQDDQHFLGLVPDSRDAEVTLLLTFDPQDSSELARRLNFWVLDANGLQRYIEGTNASEVAIAAGNRTFTGDTNERVATFTAAGSGPYTVIVYNNSQVPATYQLAATGGLLVDDSGQTLTAQQAGAVPGATVAATGTTTTTTTAVTTDATTATTPAAGTGAAGEPGGSHTVVSGDTLAIIARDVYGNFNYYVQLCAYNNISDCNRIEVGQVIQLPTLDQLTSGATAPAAAATPAAAVAATPAATTAPEVTATEETTGTTTTDTETATATPAPTAAATVAALPTATTAASTGSTGSTTAGDSIIDELESNGNFTILLSLLEAAGLTENLSGAGTYTLFAPTDSAFQAMGLADVNAVRRSPELVNNVVRFHLANTAVNTANITNGQELTTLQGSPVQFTKTGQTVKVQDSNVIVPDLTASNGVIQVIDAVMLPPQ